MPALDHDVSKQFLFSFATERMELRVQQQASPGQRRPSQAGRSQADCPERTALGCPFQVRVSPVPFFATPAISEMAKPYTTQLSSLLEKDQPRQITRKPDGRAPDLGTGDPVPASAWLLLHWGVCFFRSLVWLSHL